MSKTILVTGSGTGFGKLIAKALSEEGNGVIATMVITDDKSRETAEELGSCPNIQVVDIDLNNEKSIKDNVDHILRKYGAIDILINSTEVISIGLLEATSITQIKHILDISLFNVISMIQAVLPDMRKNKSGIILNICCGPSLFSLPFLIPQTLSKISIIALSEGLKAELKNEGIDCISVLVDSCLPNSDDNKLLDADRPEIEEAYRIESKDLIHKLKQSVSKLEPTEEKRQRVINDILNALNMKSGTRPEVIIIDKKNEHTIRELFEKKIELKNNWFERTGLKV